jgi:hypothetical protein
LSTQRRAGINHAAACPATGKRSKKMADRKPDRPKVGQDPIAKALGPSGRRGVVGDGRLHVLYESDIIGVLQVRNVQFRNNALINKDKKC